MKILQLIYESLGNPFGFGGAGTRAYEIFKRLNGRHDITFLCMKYPGAQDCSIDGIRHLFVGTEHRSITRSVFSYTLQAARYVHHYGCRYDVIVENFLPATPFFSARLTDTPVALQMQGVMGRHSFHKFSLIYGVPMYCVEKVYPYLFENFVFVTDVHNRKWMRHARRYAVIPNGATRELTEVAHPEEDYIVFLSRIDCYTKGLDLLIDAFVRVADRFCNTRLILAGHEVTSVAELLARAPHHLRDRVHYVGFVRGNEKLKLLSRAAVFVLPSRHEAHPVSLMEALACSKAAVVSDIPELHYVAEHDIGLTFENGCADDLANKLAMILGDVELRRQMGCRARAYASRFLWEDVAARFEWFLMQIAKCRSC